VTYYFYHCSKQAQSDICSLQNVLMGHRLGFEAPMASACTDAFVLNSLGSCQLLERIEGMGVGIALHKHDFGLRSFEIPDGLTGDHKGDSRPADHKPAVTARCHASSEKQGSQGQSGTSGC
jgi:hypothetical protein